MSPEQIISSRSVDLRTDLYSLGAVFYSLLTGAMPVQGGTAGSIGVSICRELPTPPCQLDPTIPGHIDQACMRLLVKDPSSRFQSTDEFLRALDGGQCSGAPNYCPACGFELQSGFRYCPGCGTRFQDVQPEIRCLACGAPVGITAACQNCAKIFGHTDHRLSFTAGPLANVVFRMPEGTYLVGRDALLGKDCHLSRQHFHVICLNGTVQVQDAGSTNRTYVSGKFARAPIVLQNGQEFRAADNTALYTCN